MSRKYWTSHCAETELTPRQRLQDGRIDEIDDNELAALILSSARSSDRSERALALRLNALKADEIGKCDFNELIQRFAVNNHQAGALLAALELGRRSGTIRQMCLTSPENTMCYLNDMGSLPKEHFRALCLDTKKRLLKMDTISIGDLNSSIAHPREIFYPAVLNLADSIIVAHNHPSGDPTPSDADIKLTRRLIRVGDLLGIKLVDHIIVSSGCYISLRREGVIN